MLLLLSYRKIVHLPTLEVIMQFGKKFVGFALAVAMISIASPANAQDNQDLGTCHYFTSEATSSDPITSGPDIINRDGYIEIKVKHLENKTLIKTKFCPRAEPYTQTSTSRLPVKSWVIFGSICIFSGMLIQWLRMRNKITGSILS